MSEKTEKPTPQRIRDARKKGQVAKSTEITSGVQLAAILGYLLAQGKTLFRAFEALCLQSIAVADQDLPVASHRLLGTAAALLAPFVVGLAALLIVATVAATLVQTGPLLAFEAMKPSPDKINPLANFKQIFSVRSLFEFAKSMIKVGLLSLIFFYLIRQYGPSIQFLPLCGVSCGLHVAVQLLYWMGCALLGFYVVFGIADYAFQRHQTMKQLMMSLEDIKEEYKNSEGNPEVKHKRKEAHREVQSGSLAANVGKSNVVVRNPTHIAVCLFYEPPLTPLPQVLEIGRNARAAHIVRLAEKAGVPVVEHVRVARALAAQTEPGGYIPPSLFEPVARILRVVMALDYEQDAERDDDGPHA
ncbi:EscU/YscU/HrcU family type III secretion system export apparatus switch protein [Trinickia caryophylli]|uniref:Type III secretion protein U n=1 Tax=Trinickia caryophylli TaxID=28094 RepID=A0A1X7EWB7_TRICW|nr:EscU/YscU/HrcU family type III secretion system export apparatus switch protein [Trinickia caryophylli]PMS09701.1 EscU/YscU/HrcU family type III secretion system export apparatus switch protein [Trinickia caryophylli]TRX18472.1 EscU/YscU/HrcU family type III secretion system export apparatus switch protein [Trinickia caryophylli]WQE10740.1 EscU/YscU/HrcU family type III secretion system export apparatus switch protein [Trinickia caryophylli]SMF41258.1 type III secretion protein U [Trinickia 